MRPQRLILRMAERGKFNWMSDEAYLKMIYRLRMGKKLDLDKPITYNEKLQWIKLYDRRPEYCVYADKYEVRTYLKERIGEECLVPLLGIYNKFEDIDFDVLPNQFVLKCTHDSGGIVICKDKSQLDIEAAKNKINRCLKNNFYYHGREWPYKNLKPRIICEKYLVDESGFELKDYKFMCFNGEPKCCIVCLNRNLNGLNVDYYDMDWNPIPVVQHYPRSGQKIAKPICFDRMVEVAKELSNGIPHIRVDFYEVYAHLYIGELTLFHGNGLREFTPESYDKLLGSWIELPMKS